MSRTLVAEAIAEITEAPVTTARVTATKTTTRTTADRRLNPRQKAGLAALVTVFGDQEQKLNGTLVNAGDGGAQLRIDARIAPSTLVKIEYSDSFLLGEVVYCQSEGSEWLAGIKVEHALFGLAALAEAIRENWREA